MKVYEIEVIEVQHVICRYFVKASSEVEAKAKAMDGYTVDINELDMIEQVNQRIVGDIINIHDIVTKPHAYQSSLGCQGIVTQNNNNKWIHKPT